MDPVKLEDIDEVILFARSLPDFPNKPTVLNRLETRNLNRYQEAQMLLNEVLATNESPSSGPGQESASLEQIQELADRIAKLGASDIVAE